MTKFKTNQILINKTSHIILPITKLFTVWKILILKVACDSIIVNYKGKKIYEICLSFSLKSLFFHLFLIYRKNWVFFDVQEPTILNFFTAASAFFTAGNAYWKERISTVDLLVLTSSDQLLFILKQYYSFFFTKQPILKRRSTVLSLPFP